MRIIPAAAGAVALALSAAIVPAATATAATKPLPCHASVNVANPHDYTDVRVRVRTAPKAAVTTVAEYRTTSHEKQGTAGRRGRITIVYYISGATPGYTVVVQVGVKKNGRTGNCSTSFTPQS